MNYKNRVVIVFTSALLVVFIISCFIVTIPSVSVSSKSDLFMPTVIIDAGHGGEDGGASTSDNYLEKDINLSISKKLKAFLVSNGFSVKMTRETDKAIYDDNQSNNKKRSDLQNRVDLFNSSKNNIVISIHQNKFQQEKYSGAQVFYSANDKKSELLAQCIKNSVVFLTQPENERQCKQAGSEIFILNNTSVPAVLIECGFLSNQNEAEKLKDDEYQSKLAYSIYLGFLEFYYRNY